MVEKEKVWTFAPFEKIKVEAEVDWDVDDGDEAPESEMVLEFTADELREADCLAEHDDANPSFVLLREPFEELLSETLTDESGFCNNGFSYEVSAFYSKNKKG